MPVNRFAEQIREASAAAAVGVPRGVRPGADLPRPASAAAAVPPDARDLPQGLRRGTAEGPHLATREAILLRLELDGA